ncbi:MAG: hypothetical protein ACT4P2_02510 [Pseudomonadota bacterium]
MTLRLSTTAALIALALGACAPRTEWVKEGAEPGDLRLSREDCARDAGRYAFVDTSFDRGYDTQRAERRVSSIEGQLYRDCMEAHGWRRQRAPETRPQ